MLFLSNAEIRDVLGLLAEEYDLNVVMGDDIKGKVDLRLKGVSLSNTLDALLVSRGYDYEIRDKIIRIARTEVIEKEKNRRLARADSDPLVMEVIVLRYLDANDVLPMVKSMLSERGSATVVERRTYKGFQFGTQGGSAVTGSTSSGGGAEGTSSPLVRGRAGVDKPTTSTLAIVDVSDQVEKIRKVIERIDVPPRQVAISAKILEVSTNSLEDLGLDISTQAISTGGFTGNTVVTDINSGSSSSNINSGVLANTFPSSTDSGLHAVFTKLHGEDITVILHALLQDRKTRTLSAPEIMTLENQEATILVGEQFPIFASSTSDQGTTRETVSRFQPIGVSLQVISQITPNDEILMIVHPTVSTLGSTVTGSTNLTAPRINIREADTRVLVKNGETLVIGGLLEDSDDERYWRVPLLGNLPLVGNLFTRRQNDVDQRNLLIFITPRIVKGGKAPMDESAGLSLAGINDPDRYGFLTERRKKLKQIYEAAKQDYRNKKYDAARDQLLRVLAIDPDHKGASEYLKKLKALPTQKPVG